VKIARAAYPKIRYAASPIHFMFLTNPTANPTPESDATLFFGVPWDAIAALGTVAAVLVAAYQIYLARRESRLRATFEHLRELESRLVAMGKVNPRKGQADVLAAYRKEVTGGLSDGALAYLSLLNALEFMALAISTGTVDKDLGKQQLKSICREHVVDTKFLDLFRLAANDPNAYKQLEIALREVAHLRLDDITVKAQALVGWGRWRKTDKQGAKESSATTLERPIDTNKSGGAEDGGTTEHER
jgi:hypothetical protein